MGEGTAEDVKIAIGAALPLEGNPVVGVRGRDLAEGLPKTINVRSHEITEAIADPLAEIVRTVKAVLRETPPELAADVIENGMVLSGGTALLRNFDLLLSEATGVPARVADEALFCVAKGTGMALENLDAYKQTIVISRPL